MNCRFIVFCSILFSFCSANLYADETWLTTRLHAPFGNFETVNAEGIVIPLAGVEIGFQKNVVRAEIESSFLLALAGPGYDVTARGGYALDLNPNSDSVYSGFLIPMIGFRYGIIPGSDSSDGNGIQNRVGAIQIATAFDSIWGRKTGFSIRGIVGGNYAVLSEELEPETWIYYRGEAMKFSLFAGVRLGMAFRL